jgi:hypothetical protein
MSLFSEEDGITRAGTIGIIVGTSSNSSQRKISTITKQQHRKAVAAAATQFYEC